MDNVRREPRFGSMERKGEKSPLRCMVLEATFDP